MRPSPSLLCAFLWLTWLAHQQLGVLALSIPGQDEPRVLQEPLLKWPIEWDPLVIPGLLPNTSVTPLALTAPMRKRRMMWLAQSMGISEADSPRVVFPAPMAFDPFSGVGEWYKAWRCSALFRRFKDLRMRAMRRFEDAGVFLGHIRILKFFLERSTADYLLVFEDDAGPFMQSGVTMGMIHELIYNLVVAGPHLHPWDVLNLGRLNYMPCKLDASLGIFQLSTGEAFEVYRPGGVVWGTQTLLYPREGARRLFEQITETGPIFSKETSKKERMEVCYPIDEWFMVGGNRFQLTLFPPMFLQVDLKSLRDPDAVLNATIVANACETHE